MQINFYDLKPQLSSIENGSEPSIRELLEYYYSKHSIPANKATIFTNAYIKELEKMRRSPFEVFISGPSAYASVIMREGLSSNYKSNGYETVIEGLAQLTGDDPDDYTVTKLSKYANNISE